ncbi:MAG: MFS transporter [Candidatus Diapherotrites archaeon]|nr:MFS transporter [Candidatus Diapherotrites archaeon]
MGRSTLIQRGLEGNLWKLLAYTISQRRNFFPILSIYFLTLPGADAQQIGLYSAIGFLVSFLIEIPSGYMADHIGHRKTLILSKVFMVLSTLSFLTANSLPGFILGASFLSLSFAFQSGTLTAFLYDTLQSLKREKEYARQHSRIAANGSLVSMVLMFSLPFLVPIDIRLPFLIVLAFDLVGMAIVFALKDPPVEKEHRAQPYQSITKLIHDAKESGMLPFVMFTGLIGGFMIGISAFREPYLLSLGMPIALIGLVMGGSRLIWYVVGTHIQHLEKFPFRRLIQAELFLFPGMFILASVIQEVFLTALIFMLTLGYLWGRSHLMEDYFIRTYIRQPKYKATLLSIHSQVSLIIQALVAGGAGYLMAQSYSLGFLVSGISLFLLLGMVYLFLQPQLRRGVGIADH